jgi:hypothetical protein
MSSLDLPALSPQDPAPAPPPPPAPDIALAKSRMMRLIKLRADQLQVPQIDDMDRVVSPAITDSKQAGLMAKRAFFNYAKVNPDLHGQIRDFITGKSADYPENWDLGDTPYMSRETLEAQSAMQQAQEGRERNPVAAAAFDYVGSPILKIYGGAAQVMVNVGAGVANVFGANIEPLDVQAEAIAKIQQMTGTGTGDVDKARQQLGAMSETGSLPAKIAGQYGDIKGMIKGLTGPVGSQAISAGGLIPGALAKMGGAGEKAVGFARAAGGFAGYEALTTRGVDKATGESRTPTAQERIEAAGHGAVMGTVMHGAGQIASAALRGIFKTPAKNLDPVGRDLVTALKDFGIKNKILPVKGQTQEAYGEQLLDGWIKARMTGAPLMPFRKLFGHAVKGGIEGAGLTHLDAQFREDLYGSALEPGVLQGNFENLERVIATFAGTALGVASFSRPLKDIPNIQRNIPTPGTRRAEQQPQQPSGRVESPLNRAQQEALESLFWHHKFELDRMPGGKGRGAIDSAQETREGNRFDTEPAQPGAAPVDRPRDPEMEAAEARGERIIGERYTEVVEGPGRREIEAQWDNLLGADMIRLGWRPVKEFEIPAELQSMQSPLERAGYDIVSNELGRVKIKQRETNATRELTEQEFYDEFGREKVEEQGSPERIDYTKDDTRREFLAQQARDFPEGTATVQVGGNVANLAMRFLPQRSEPYQDLLAAQGAGGGTVRFTAQEARKFIDYHARTAPRRRLAKSGDVGVEQSNIQALDSLAEKLVEAFGLGKVPPRGERREGPDVPPSPGEPMGEPYRPDVPEGPERREGPGEGGGDVEVPPKGKKPRGGPAAARKPDLEMELPGTDHSYTLEDGYGWASPKLEDLLDIETPMPAKEFSDLPRRASLLSALDSKRLLPGTLVSADGIVAEPGAGEAKGVMRTIRMGEVLEAALSPDPKWGPAASFPARGQDALHPIQEAAVEALKGVLNGRPDLSQADTVMLSKIIDLVDTVSAKNDQAVAETIQALPDALRGMANGSPEHAGKVIVAVAEMLTTKTPDVAIDDMVKAADAKRTAPEDITYDAARATAGQATREFAEVHKQYRAREIDNAEFLAGKVLHDKAMEAFDAAETAFIDAKNAVEQPSQWKRKESGRSGESGMLDVGDAAERVAEAGKKAIDMAVRMPVRALGYALSPFTENPLFKGFATGVIEKVREKNYALGQRAFVTEANTRRIEDEMNPTLGELSDIANKRHPELEKMHWQEPTESGYTAGFEEAHVQKETALQDLLNTNRSHLSEEVQQSLALHDRLTYAIREKAHDLGVKIRSFWSPEGELVDRNAKKDVLTRQSTPVAEAAIKTGEGWVYEAIVESLAKLHGMSKAEVEKVFEEDGFTRVQGIKRTDPIETMRRFKYFPDHVKSPNGKVERLLETHLLRHAKRMVSGAAKRLGTIEEWGADEPLKTGEDAKERYADGMHVPYLSVVESVPRNQRQMVATMFRALMGMSTNAPSQLAGEVGGGWHKTVRFFDALNNVKAAMGMTFGSPIQNMIETWGTATALLGRRRLNDAANTVHSALAGNRLKELLKQRVEAGGFELYAPEFILGGEHSTFEQVINAMRTTQSTALLPFELTQVVTDAKVHIAWHEAVDGWRDGRSEGTDVDTLKTMFGFTQAHAEQVVKGDAPPIAYDQIARNGLTRITRRGSMPANKSAFALSRAGNWIKYLGYFQEQSAKLGRSVANMRNAETPEQAMQAAHSFGKLMGWNLAAYMAGQATIKLFQGGWDEMLGFFGETFEDLKEDPLGGGAKLAGAALVGSFFGSAGSAVGGGLYSLITGSDKDLSQTLESALHAIPAIGAVVDTGSYIRAQGHNLAGTPIPGDSPYAGKSPLQQLGYFIGREIPLAKWVERGPFGLGITYLGTDPELENAIKAAQRYDSKRGLDEDHDPNADDLFTNTMRAAVHKLRAEDGGSNVDEVADAIREAMPEKDDSAIAASFRSRRILAGRSWESLTEDQQASKLRSLGEARVELLQGYDAVLENAAEFFTPTRLRRRRR